MRLEPWIGKLVIGLGWALLDARIGHNQSHSHLADQVTLGLDGQLEVCADRNISAPAGRAVYIPSRCTHSLGDKGRRIRSIYFDRVLASWNFLSDLSNPSVLSEKASEDLLNIHSEDGAKNWAQSYLLRHRKPPDPRIAGLLDLGVDQLCKRPDGRSINLSQNRLRELCVRDYGAPPSKLHQWRQLQLAAKSIAQAKNVSTAAAEAGYADQSHFTRRLKEWFGVTPSSGLAQLKIVCVK